MIYVIASAKVQPIQLKSSLKYLIELNLLSLLFLFIELYPDIGSTVESRQNPGQVQQNINTK